MPQRKGVISKLYIWVCIACVCKYTVMITIYSFSLFDYSAPVKYMVHSGKVNLNHYESIYNRVSRL